MKRQVVDLPLHYGEAPRWLFERQKKLLYEICRVIILEFGTEELLKRLSEPLWFQLLGCISGFDWHSSGVTTTVTGAIKEVFKNRPEYGIYVFGGKGKTARKTPEEIRSCRYIEDKDKFITISKLTAKVDNSCIQDGYQIYHHTIFIDTKGNWTVVQQGMNTENRYARRYHWFNKTSITDEDSLIIEPHSGIITQKKEFQVLNFVDKTCKNFQKNIVEYINNEKPENIVKVFVFPQRHYITKEDFDVKKLYRTVCNIKDIGLNSFKDLLLIEGVGPKTLRALSLISEVVYGEQVSKVDPARFSFAFGGKDGHPYPVDKKLYDETLNLFKYIVDKAYIEGKDKLRIFRMLSTL